MLSCQRTVQEASEASNLFYMERDWNDAAKRNDMAWVERNYASDATDVSSRTGVIHTKAEEIASMKGDKTVLESLELSDLNVRIDGSAGASPASIRSKDAMHKERHSIAGLPSPTRS